jgi:diaminopimelate epimerase
MNSRWGFFCGITLQSMHFVKLDAAGNDFVALDFRAEGRSAVLPSTQQLMHWCDRKRGVGADGVLVMRAADEREVAYELSFFNPDGSPAFCGNGARAAFWWARQLGAPDQLVFRAIDGLHQAQFSHETGCAVGVYCKEQPRATAHGQFVNSGTQHVVQLLDTAAQVRDYNMSALARPVRHHADFAPEGVNVNIASKASDGEGRHAMRTFEKGVECETLSCGSGAVAVAKVLQEALVYNGPVHLIAPGGVLKVWTDAADVTWLAGPVAKPFIGEFTK